MVQKHTKNVNLLGS